MSLRFSKTYQPGLWTGEMLHTRCELDGIDGIALAITGIQERNFKDADKPEWVLSFGKSEPEYRLRKNQWQNANALANAFGEDGEQWIGQNVVLKPRHVEWTDRETGEKKSGFTIDVIPVPPPPGSIVKRTFDDEIPF